ncbi:hypothetical protein ACFL45_02350 [Candidatus Neomarinimicrobiota bacterium]
MGPLTSLRPAVAGLRRASPSHFHDCPSLSKEGQAGERDRGWAFTTRSRVEFNSLPGAGKRQAGCPT